MNLYVDCEFNSYLGELISMAMVSEDGEKEFYEILDHRHMDIHPWVKENVLPVLDPSGAKPLNTLASFQKKLELFLSQFAKVKIHADYPADLYHVARCIETGPGDTMKVGAIQRIELIMDERLSAKKSEVPHNALEDARALARGASEVENTPVEGSVTP